MSHVLGVYIDVPDNINPATTDPDELAELLFDPVAAATRDTMGR